MSHVSHSVVCLASRREQSICSKIGTTFLFQVSGEQRNNKAPNLSNPVKMMKFMLLASIVAICSADYIDSVALTQLASPSENLQGYS